MFIRPKKGETSQASPEMQEMPAQKHEESRDLEKLQAQLAIYARELHGHYREGRALRSRLEDWEGSLGKIAENVSVANGVLKDLAARYAALAASHGALVAEVEQVASLLAGSQAADARALASVAERLRQIARKGRESLRAGGA